MMKPIFATGAMLGFSALLAFGQTPTPPTPPTTAQIVSNIVSRLTKLLDLSSTQQAEATAIFTTEQTALATVRTSLQTAHTALQTAITANDTGTIATEAAQIGTLTGQQVQAQATAAAAFYADLNSDQQSKYTTLGPMLGPGGPGGFGGPGGPGPRGFGGSH
jgi:hypothetical protein